MTEISSDGKCEWDSEKNLKNIRNHHLSFETLSKIFYDPFFVEIADEEHSFVEERFQGFGSIGGITIVTVFYTERNSDGVERHRLISARKLDAEEKKAYAEFLQSYTGTN